jgi:hypothetical protein
MTEELIILNTTDIGLMDIVANLPPEIGAPLGTLILILQAVGVIFFIYLVFLIAMSVLNIKRGIKINKIFNRVNDMDEKLDSILKKLKKGNKKK